MWDRPIWGCIRCMSMCGCEATNGLVPSDNAGVDTTCQEDASALLAYISSYSFSYKSSYNFSPLCVVQLCLTHRVSITAHSGTFTDCSDRSFKSSPRACCPSDVPTKLFNKGRFSSSPKRANMNESSYFFIYNIQGGFFSFVSSKTDHRAGLVWWHL